MSGKDFIKEFCISLREHAENMIDCEKKAIFNKGTTKIKPRSKIMLHLWKKNLTKACLE